MGTTVFCSDVKWEDAILKQSMLSDLIISVK